MLRWLIRPPSDIRKSREELEKAKANDRVQRLLLREALQELADERAALLGNRKNGNGQ